MDRQLATDWRRALDQLARSLNPLHAQIFKASPLSYYWLCYYESAVSGFWSLVSGCVFSVISSNQGPETKNQKPIHRIAGQSPYYWSAYQTAFIPSWICRAAVDVVVIRPASSRIVPFGLKT